MENNIYRFRFNRECLPRDILETIELAVLGAQCLHGESHVQLDTRYCSNLATNTYIIDASTDVGRDIVLLFTGFAIREFGEKSISVKRIETFPILEKATA